MTKYNSELNDDKKVPTNEEVYDESSHNLLNSAP